MILGRIFSVINSSHNIFHVIESVQEGSVFVPAGKHAIEIKTRKTPVDVLLSLAENTGMQVCNGDIDKVGYTLLPNGFVLYADVVSDALHIEWNAFFDIEGNTE